MADIHDDINFIGIIANDGEFGQLVWLVGASLTKDLKAPIEWHVWTYKDFKKKDYVLPASEESNIIWYREPDHNQNKT